VAVTQDKTKISAYVDRELQKHLSAKADEMGLSVSQLLGKIAAEYLGFSSGESSIGSPVHERIEKLEAALAELGERTDGRFIELTQSLLRIDELEGEVQLLRSLKHQAGEDKPAPESRQLDTSSIAVDLPESRSGRDLAIRLGSSPSTVSIESRKGRDSFLDWSSKRDPESLGWWRERSEEKLFRPVSQLLTFRAST